MKIDYKKVADLERGYSIALVPGREVDGYSAFLAGSEGKGELLYFEPPEYKPQVIAREPGGFISIAPLFWKGKRYVVASTRFYPFFEAAESTLMVYPLDEGECPEGVEIGKLPFAHRIAIHTKGERAWLLVSTLCGGKEHKDDWSRPGGIHLLNVPDELDAEWPERKIVPGLNKNHGMDYAELGKEREQGYLLSAREGLLFLTIPEDPDSSWPVRTLDEREHSDAFASDWIGTGIPEIFSISPFHGHVLSRHTEEENGSWHREEIDQDLAMGHVVWAGQFLGSPGLLAGSRREKRELRLYRPTDGAPRSHDYQLLDEGIGPTQMIVEPQGDERAILYMAAHGVNEVRVYTLER